MSNMYDATNPCLISYPLQAMRPYYMPSPMNAPMVNSSWWVQPENADTEAYNQWYASTYKTVLQNSQDQNPMDNKQNKIKNFKKKIDFIDPKADAGRINLFFTFYYS